MQTGMSWIKRGLTLGGLSAILLVFPMSLSAAGNDYDFEPDEVLYQWGWGPGWGPGWGYYAPYYYQPTTGELKLKHVDDNDRVYINGAFAGKAGDVESMDLAPGSYHIVIEHNGKEVLNQKVYVTLGKTVKLYVGDKPSG